jgi:hypothetical protein
MRGPRSLLLTLGVGCLIGCESKQEPPSPPAVTAPAGASKPPVKFPVGLGDPISAVQNHFGDVPQAEQDVLLEGMLERKGIAPEGFTSEEWWELMIFQMHEVNRGPILQESTTFSFRYHRPQNRIWWISILDPQESHTYTLHGISLVGSIDDCLGRLGKPAKQQQSTIILTRYYWIVGDVGYQVSAYHADYSDAVRGTRRKGQLQYILVVSFVNGPPGLREVFLDL